MDLKDELCFECEAPAEHQHHVVPRSRGGTQTLPLCTLCHSAVHEQALSSPQLVKEGIARSRAAGTKWGKPRHRKFEAVVRMYENQYRLKDIAKELKISYGSVVSVLRTWRRNKA